MSIMMDFNKQAAENWKTEVEDLFTQVDAELKNVADECAMAPGEDDTIFQEIDKAGRNLGAAWEGLKGIFQDTIVAIGDIFSRIGQFVQDAAERVRTFGENFET